MGGHVSQDWDTGGLRRFIEALAVDRRVVRFDRIGTGASDRDRPVDEFTLDAEVAALAAVVDALELDSFALLGISRGGCTAARYAAREPERVEQLVLYGSYANGRRLAAADVRLGTPLACGRGRLRCASRTALTHGVQSAGDNAASRV